MPYYWKIAPVLERLPIQIPKIWDGRGYIGVVSTFCFWIFVLFSIRYLFTRYLTKKTLQIPVEMGLFAPAFFAAIIFFLFAMGYPFKLGLEFLLDWMSFIKNFRTTSRFVWPFFFVATTFAAYAINQYVQVKWKPKKKIYIYFLLIIAPVLTIIEGIPYQKRAYNDLFKLKNVFLLQNLNPEHQQALKIINSDEYQAIIPIPFYQGSSNYIQNAPYNSGFDDNYDIYDISQILAYHFELPLMASYFSRTSIWESKNLIQMFAPQYYKKLITDDFPSNKKLLILCLRGDEAINEYEQFLLTRATFLLKSNQIEFWEITPEKLTEIVTAPYFADFNQKRAFLFSQENYFLSKPDSTVFLLSFDNNPSPHIFLGSGAYEQPRKEQISVFAEIEPGKLDENREYEASFWYYIGGKNHGQDKLSWRFYISQKDEKSGEVFSLLAGWSRTTPVISGDWALATYRFSIPNRNLSTQFAISDDV